MKKLAFILSVVIITLSLLACGNEYHSAGDREHGVVFPAYEEKNINNLPFIDQINQTPPFMVVGDFPKDWAFKNEKGDETLPLGEFYTPVYIYNNDKLLGYIGFNVFEPYTDEIEPENYYKTVWPALRISSFFNWEPFTSVIKSDTAETGIADIWYLNPNKIDNHPSEMANVQILESLGILSYNKQLGVFIGIAFMPDSITREEAQHLAESVKILPIE